MSSVYGLCNALAGRAGMHLRVLTTDTAGLKLSESVPVTNFPMIYPPGYEVFFCHRQWAASFSTDLLLRLWPMIRWADVVHLTAVYSPPTIPTLLICRLLNKPVVWSPRGALQRWEKTRKPLVKKVWERICNALICRTRCILHVTSDKETRESFSRISNSEPAVIPNGVDVPELPNREWQPAGTLRLLYLGRLHPIKGIENLLRAVTLLNDRSVSLSVYGSGEDRYVESLKTLAGVLRLKDSVVFQGHVIGAQKLQAFIQADVCVLPSFSENFGMVVAESLAHGVPVIASTKTPWQDLEKNRCGMWVDNSPATLAQSIEGIRNEPLAEMGRRGRAWMGKEFSWESAALSMSSLYQQLIATSEPCENI
jgi:glycosyltransferase involved in cell wall biosynthesis